jgi:hypothetical protein
VPLDLAPCDVDAPVEVACDSAAVVDEIVLRTSHPSESARQSGLSVLAARDAGRPLAFTLPRGGRGVGLPRARRSGPRCARRGFPRAGHAGGRPSATARCARACTRQILRISLEYTKVAVWEGREGRGQGAALPWALGRRPAVVVGQR